MTIMKLGWDNKIDQGFIRVKTPRTNGQAERVSRTLPDMWRN